MIDPTYDFPCDAFACAWPPTRTRPYALWLLLAAGAWGAPKAATAQQTPVPAPSVQPAPVQETPMAQALRQAANPAPLGFGQPGQIFVSLGTESLLQGIWASGFENTFSVELAPAVGFFFSEHLYARLGFEMQLDQLPKAAQDVGDLRTFALSVAPGVGGAWRLHPKVSVAPWVGVGLGRVWRSQAFSGYRSTLDVQAGVPFIFDFLEHVSFFVAPTYKQLVVNRETFPESSRQASLGGRLGISMGALGHW